MSAPSPSPPSPSPSPSPPPYPDREYADNEGADHPRCLIDFIDVPRWVAWRNEEREGRDGKLTVTKVPYFAPNRQAKADDPTTWLPHDRAAIVRDAIVNGAGGGIGIELGECGYRWIVGIDLDTCRDPATGTIEPWAVKVIAQFATYAEVSPSETGLKLFFMIEPADVPALRALMGTQHGRQWKRAGAEHPPAIELYVSNRYFAVTWKSIDDDLTELRVVPLADLRWLVEEAGPRFVGVDTGAAAGGNHSSADQSRSAVAFRKGADLIRAGKTYDEMVEALRADPETSDWATEKGEPNGGRELRRIWAKANADRQHPAEAWPEPVDILADQDPGAAPILDERHIPKSLWPFVSDAAERMGGATSTVALCAIVSCSAAISDEWRLQPKRYDFTWTERACLWGAPVGLPSTMKSPIISLATAPLDSLEIDVRQQWDSDMASYRALLAEWKEGGKVGQEPRAPRCARYMVESTTVEALQEVLRDDSDGRFYAPLGKVMCRQDELAEFIAGMDRYSSGSRGSDRGAYLQLYNGGRFTVDRIGRGSFVTKSWSGCILGGIQPGPIQQIARDATDDGLIQRFIFDVPPPCGKGQDRAPNGVALQNYRSLFPALAALRPPARTDADRQCHVVLHADAHGARESIDEMARVMSLWPDASPQIQATFGKWPGLFARLCLVFHLVEVAAARGRGDIGPPLTVVAAETAARVRAYMREVLAPMLLRADAVMFASRQTSHAAWIANFITASSLDRISAREIVQSYRQLRAPEHRDTLESTMDSLCVFGWLKPEPMRGGATRPTAWRVNPRVHTRFAERGAAERTRRDAVKAAIAAHVAELRGDVVNVA